jgi:hypothetical protein
MKNASTIMTNNEEEAVKESEGDGVDCEKVHRGNDFTVVLEKSPPPDNLFRVSRRPLDSARNGALRDIETKHL